MKRNIPDIKINDLIKVIYLAPIFLIFSCSNIFKNHETQLGCSEQTDNIYLKFNDSFLSVDTASKNILASIDESKIGDHFEPIIKYNPFLIDYILISDEIIECGEEFDFGILNRTDSIVISLVKNNIEVEYLITFTTLPVVSIVSEQYIKDEPKISSNFWLNNINGRNYNNLFGGIEIRGASSQNYPKKSYDIEFWKDFEGGDSEDYTFFHMRNDDDWILDAMYIDLSKVRNLTAMIVCSLITTERDLYLLSNQKLFQSGKLIELNINNDYLGIYSLNEQIDKKQLGLSDESFIYKADYYSEETLMEGISSSPSSSHLWNGFELKYPKNENVQNWDKIYDLVDKVAYSNDSSFSSTITEMINFDNLIDYWLIINISQAIDNMGKNYFIFCNSRNDPLMFSPWDLDLAFSNQNFYVSFPIDEILSNKLIDRLIELNLNNFKSLLKSRWLELNLQELHEEILRYSNNKISRIKSSGADLREQQRWLLVSDLDNEIDYINSWLTNRLEFLDDYILSRF